MRGLDTVLFDWDGTLVHSERVCYEAFSRSMEHFGVPFSEEIYARHFTPDWRRMYRELGLPESRWAEAEELWTRHYGERVPELRAGAENVMRALRERGVLLGVVSSGSRARVKGEIAAHGFSGSFGAVVCGEDVRLPKPNPEGVLRALGQLQKDPRRSCYVGDHPVDMETGRRAGVRVFGIRSGFPAPGLGEAADRLLASLDELLLFTEN